LVHPPPPPPQTNERNETQSSSSASTNILVMGNMEGTKNKVLTAGWLVGDSIECYHQFYLIIMASENPTKNPSENPSENLSEKPSERTRPRTLPLRGSSAPIRFIYDATPAPVDGGLVAAASAFFSHQGHQVFHNPCPVLAAYCLALGVPSSSIVPVDRLPDYLLSLGLDILAGLWAPSPTDAALQGTAFMAACLSPSASGLPLGGASVSSPSVGLSAVGPRALLPDRLLGGSSAALARPSAPPPVSSLRAPVISGGPPFSGSRGPVDPGGLSPPLQSSASQFMGGSVPPSSTPVQNPYVSLSRLHHTAPGGFHGGPTHLL
jgi:hypothetical protein